VRGLPEHAVERILSLLVDVVAEGLAPAVDHGHVVADVVADHPVQRLQLFGPLL